MRKQFAIWLGVIFVIFLTACSNNDKPKNESSNEDSTKLTVSAAVSLKDALKEIEDTYGKEHNISFTFNLGSSGTLAQQIKQGAPVDVFISANEAWMDDLEESEEIVAKTRKDVTENTIVLITAKDKDTSVKAIDGLTKDNSGQIAIGNPKNVPAGIYTKELLTNLNIWDELEPNFIQAKDVRQVLTYVESGNAEFGFVYQSDALISDQVEVIDVGDTELYGPIIYPGAVTVDSKESKVATEFLEYLESEAGQEILEKYGFGKE